MSQRTLGNGVNALDYFHQLVKILTPSGEIMDPSATRMGMANATQRQIPVANLEKAAEVAEDNKAPVEKKVVKKKAVKKTK